MNVTGDFAKHPAVDVWTVGERDEQKTVFVPGTPAQSNLESACSSLLPPSCDHYLKNYDLIAP